MKPLFLLSLLLPMLLQGCAARKPVSPPPHYSVQVRREVEFSLPFLRFGKVLPGSYTGVIRVKNVTGKPLHQVEALTSCACLVPDKDAHTTLLKPGATLTLPFTVEMSGEKEFVRTIGVSSPDLQREFFAQILAEVESPLPGQTGVVELPALKRRSTGEATSPLIWSTPVSTLAQSP